MPTLKSLPRTTATGTEETPKIPGQAASRARSFTNIPSKAGTMNPEAGSEWEYVEDVGATGGAASRGGVAPPGPRPTDDALSLTQQLLDTDFSRRQDFEQNVIEELGANPTQIDPAAEVAKASAMLPEIFEQTFGGQIPWAARNRLTPEQAEHWNNVVGQFQDYVFNRANAHRQALMSQYEAAMKSFDEQAKRKQAILDKLEERQYEKKQKMEDRAWTLATEDRQAAKELAKESRTEKKAQKKEFEKRVQTDLSEIADLRQEIAKLQTESAKDTMGTQTMGYQNQMNALVRELSRKGNSLAAEVIKSYQNIENPTDQDKQNAKRLLETIATQVQLSFEPRALSPDDTMTGAAGGAQQGALGQ